MTNNTTKQKPSGYWEIYENNYKEARKYNSKSEFAKGCGSAYKVACKNGLLDNYTWFETKQKPRGYWEIYENNYNEARKYNSRSEFAKACSGAYRVALKKCLLDNYIWFEKDLDPYKNKKHTVYCYIYENNVYVGITIDAERRHKEHSTDEQSTVYKFAKQNNILIPQLTELETNLSIEEAREKEDFYVKKFKQEKWNVLNKAKTGKNCGSLGGLNNGKWNEQTCYQEAQKYKSRSEFEKGCETAYKVALKKGLLDNYIWFTEQQKPSGYWEIYENNYKEAKKYKSRNEFKKACSGAYRVALKKGWLDNYTWFAEKQKHGYWNYETCYQEAQKYKSRTKFKKGCGSAYEVTRENGWLDIFFPKGK